MNALDLITVFIKKEWLSSAKSLHYDNRHNVAAKWQFYSKYVGTFYIDITNITYHLLSLIYVVKIG